MPVNVAVAIGGALGAVCRYWLDRVIERRSFAVFPWSTFAVNVSGCFLIASSSQLSSTASATLRPWRRVERP